MGSNPITVSNFKIVEVFIMNVRIEILLGAVLALVVSVTLNMTLISAILGFMIGVAVYSRIPRSWVDFLNKKL